MNDHPPSSLPPSWRCRLEGRDSLVYEERDADGGWRSLSFASEQCTGASPHHVLIIESETPWRRERPEWARGRRAEILWRLQAGFGSGVRIDTVTRCAPEDCDDQGWRIVRLKVGESVELFYEEDVQDPKRGMRTERLKINAATGIDGRRTIRHDDEGFWSRYMPPWARGRREQIIARIRRGCPAPDFIHLPQEN